METHVETLILGGGLTGISASYHLKHKNCLILEKNDYLFGHIASITSNGFTWDEGPHVSFTKHEYVKSLFEKISDEDINLIGLSSLWCRPEWLICSVLPVPPPCVRPSVKQDNSQRMDDDLTHKLVDIIKANNQLKRKIAENARIEVVNDWTKLLQYHCATLVDNDIPGLSQAAHRSGRALKSIRQRLKGKEGRIRNNLMGKRVDFSARSVITPDPNLDLDELGVPYKIAMNLTFPEKVSIFNINL